MVNAMNTLLSIWKATQFKKYLLSIYYMQNAVLSVHGSEMNKTQIMASMKDHSHLITLQEAKEVCGVII